MLLSFVIPTMNLKCMVTIVNDLKVLDYRDDIELIIVNQSQISWEKTFGNELKILCKEIKPKTIMSASKARNLGASYASGKYLFFLDDDAFFWGLTNETFILLTRFLQKGVDCVVVQRGELIQGEYVSHWPNVNRQPKLSVLNYSRYIIEWNVIIDNLLFYKFGGFRDIGPGSKHMAQCGEALILGFQIIENNHAILYPSIKVCHPSLTNITLQKEKKYQYGISFAYGVIIDEVKKMSKVVWFSRFSIYLIKILFTKPVFIKYMLLGFADSIFKGEPRVESDSK